MPKKCEAKKSKPTVSNTALQSSITRPKFPAKDVSEPEPAYTLNCWETFLRRFQKLKLQVVIEEKTYNFSTSPLYPLIYCVENDLFGNILVLAYGKSYVIFVNFIYIVVI